MPQAPRRSAVVVAGIAVTILGAGCGDDPRSLGWEVRFADPSVADRASAIAAEVLEGGCAGDALWGVQYALADGPAGPAAPTLGPGRYGFRVVARDALCRRIAEDCSPRDLPLADGARVESLLAAVSRGADCGAETCLSGVCATTDGGVAGCPEGRGDCNDDPTDGCEVQLDTDLAHCGACAARCVLAHATSRCTGGLCEIAACEADWADCDGDPATGCEVSLVTQTDCGRCGNLCEYAHGVGACTPSGCEMTGCHPGWGDCDTTPTTGCEQDLTVGSACGSCTGACPAATPLCAVDATGGTSCVAACPATSPTACGTTCTDLTRDPNHCGACTNGCAPSQASARCLASACAVGTCNEGWGDCDVAAVNGCESSLATLAHCGGCGSTCTAADALLSCEDGACEIDACLDPLTDDCDGLVGNGCEADLTAALTCGSCDGACTGATPLCGLSPSRERRCLASCAPPAATQCGDVCLDTDRDRLNCGACGMRCELPDATETCLGGECLIVSCPPGLGDCDGVPANGCESDLVTDLSSCGACGNVCPTSPGLTASCVGGECHSGACAPGTADCNMDAADACETDVTTDAHCGACDRACGALPNATSSCMGGVCRVSACDAGFGDCNLEGADGCEVDHRVDVVHCGTCGNRCRGVTGRMCCAGVCGEC